MSQRLGMGRLQSVPLEMIERLEERRLLSFTAFPFPPVAGGQQFFSAAPAVAAGADGNLWVADSSGVRILRVKPDGAITQFPLSKDADPIAITAGPDGNVWYADDLLNTLDRVTPAGKITPFAVPNVGKDSISPTAITRGPDGNLWFVAFDNNTFDQYVGRATSDGHFTLWLVKTNATLFTIASVPDGNVWIGGDTTLGRITPAGAISLFSMPDGVSSMVAGPDGNLWISTFNNPFGFNSKPSVIERVSTAGKVTATFSSGAPAGDVFTNESITNLTVGSDGNFWFATNGSSNQLGRMTPSGVFSEFAVPGGTPYAFLNVRTTHVASVVSAPDGNLWYVPDSGDQIVRFNFHNAILASSEYVDTTAGSATPSTVATFIDTGPALPASAYSATVGFPDGSSANAIVASDGHGAFKVTLNQNWPLGTLSTNVKITQGSRSATASDYVTAIPPTPTGTGVNISAVAGTQFSGNVADFTQVVLASLDQYQFSSIDWGDGQFSDGTLVPDGKGGAFLQGSHGYATSGHFNVQAAVEPPFIFPRLPFTPGSHIPPPFLGPGFSESHATVTAGVMNGDGNTLLAQAHHAITQAFASFTLTDKSSDISHYHAKLEWGDIYTDPQHPSIPMTILPRDNGTFAVTAPVTFAAQGIAYYRITISDDRLSGDAADVGLAYGQVIVDYPTSKPPPDEFGDQVVDLTTAHVEGAVGGAPDPNAELVDLYNPTLAEIVHSIGKSLTASTGQNFSGDVGTLVGVIPGNPRLKDLHGTIDWGDGNSSAAIYTRDAKGIIHVQGVHAYAKPGKYKISVRTSQIIFQDGVGEYGMPDIRLPSIVSSIRVA